MRKVVVADENVVTLDDVTTNKCYVMKGRKGEFILARDVDGNFMWVRLTPAKTTKPVNRFDSAKKAIEAKLELGYEVFEYTEATLS